MNDLELTETIFGVYGIKYHKLVEGDNTYLTPYGKKDTEGNIYFCTSSCGNLQGMGLKKYYPCVPQIAANQNARVPGSTFPFWFPRDVTNSFPVQYHT